MRRLQILGLVMFVYGAVMLALLFTPWEEWAANHSIAAFVSANRQACWEQHRRCRGQADLDCWRRRGDVRRIVDWCACTAVAEEVQTGLRPAPDQCRRQLNLKGLFKRDRLEAIRVLDQQRNLVDAQLDGRDDARVVKEIGDGLTRHETVKTRMRPSGKPGDSLFEDSLLVNAPGRSGYVQLHPRNSTMGAFKDVCTVNGFGTRNPSPGSVDVVTEFR